MKAGLVGWLQTTPHLGRYGRFVGSVGGVISGLGRGSDHRRRNQLTSGVRAHRQTSGRFRAPTGG
jgi:hypothetical protein